MFKNRPTTMLSQRVRAILHALFVIYLFLYFYYLQYPLLELGQLGLSEGQTTYHRLVSAGVLTLLLSFLQRMVDKWVRFPDMLYAFSYLPSVLLAVLATAFVPEQSKAVLLFVAVGCIGFAWALYYRWRDGDREERVAQSFPRLLSTHAVGMMAVFLSLGLFSHSDDIVSYEVRTGHLLQEGKYEEALQVGQRSLAVSPRLVALRAYAMAHTEEGMGERLFAFPLAQVGAEQLLFSPGDSLAQLLSPDSLYVQLEAWKSPRESAVRFFRRASAHNRMAAEYYLSALLLEKDLEQFAQALPRYYELADTVCLPRYYREALTVCAAEQGWQLPFSGDSLLQQSYADFETAGASFDHPAVRSNEMRRKYGDTYWWYYHYQH